MKQKTMRDFWIDELKDLYNAENQILKALPKMAKNASSDELREAFEEHLKQTGGHVKRLDQIFRQIGLATGRGKKCKGMEGVIEEGKEVLEEDLPDAVADAAMIGAAQKVEHYEIAAYGTARTHAEILGENEAVDLLEQTLQEEKETDERLTELAEEINLEAEEESEVGGNGDGRARRRKIATARR